jgi:phage terminase large subunit-like protein
MSTVDYSSMSTPELEEYLALLETKQNLEKASPISFYVPHSGQEPFHRSPARIRDLEGGNRGGKTTAGATEATAHALGYRPWLSEDDPDYWVRNARGQKIPVPNTGIIAAESFNVAIQETILPTLLEWLPAGLIVKKTKNQARVVARLELQNGSVIRLMAYNQDPKEYEGTKYHWIWYDEPPPQSIFIASQRGLVDFSGKCWFTMTPLKEPWIYTDIVSQAGLNPDIAHFNFSSDTNPHIPKEALEAYFSSIKDPAMREARRSGKPLHLQGLVFPEWKPEKPFWIPYFQPPKEWVRVMGIDPHPRKPIAVVWAAISPVSDIWYVYRELYDPDLRLASEVCEAIKRAETFEEIDYRCIDWASRENERTSDSSVFQQFEKYFPLIELADKTDKLGRIEQMHGMLDTDNTYQTPQLVVMDTCRRVRHEFMNYIWEDWAIQTTRQDRDPKPETRKKDDDCLDILMYLRQYGQDARDFRPEDSGGVRRPTVYRRSRTGY